MTIEKRSGEESGGAPKARRRADVESLCMRFEDQCRRRGIRVTPQRLAVYRILAEDDSHPTAESVYARLRQTMRSLSPATVYRVLESLEHEGLVRRVSSIGGIGRFDANLSRHQHLVCRLCGAMMDFAADSLASLEIPRTSSEDFTAEELDIRIVGVCAGCRRKGHNRQRA